MNRSKAAMGGGGRRFGRASGSGARFAGRPFAAAVAFAAGIAASTGCGGPQTAEPVRFWHAMTGPLGKSLDGLVAEWPADAAGAARSPIESVSMGQYEALSQKIMASVAAGGPPDIAQCYEAWTANLVANGSIVSFDDFVAGPDGLDAASVDDVFAIFREGATQNGKLWSFPFNKSVRCLYYNKDRFREAGLDPGRPPRTWDEYRDFAKRLTRDEDGNGTPEKWGVAGQITVSVFENLIVQNGGRLLDESERHAAFHGDEGVEALEFMANLFLRDGSAILTPGFEYQNEFLAGNVGMIEGSSVSLSFLEGKYAFELGIAPLPAGKVDTQIVAGTDVVLFATTRERETQAWRFVKWFTETPQTAKWSAQTGYLPVRKSAFDDPALAAVLDAHPGLREAYAQIDRALPQPKARGWYAGRRILETEAIEAVLRGRAEPRAALEAAAIRVDAELLRESGPA